MNEGRARVITHRLVDIEEGQVKFSWRDYRDNNQQKTMPFRRTSSSGDFWSAHQIIIQETRKLARRAIELGDDGSNDFLISEVLRTNELQVWFLSEHLVKVPVVEARETSSAAGAA
jgi:hypothetical protein